MTKGRGGHRMDGDFKPLLEKFGDYEDPHSLAMVCLRVPGLETLIDLTPSEYMEGEQAYYEELARLIAAPYDEIRETMEGQNETVRYEYLFTDEMVIAVLDEYAGGSYWQKDVNDKTKERRETRIKRVCKETREYEEKERGYTNNLVVPWDQYKTPGVQKGWYKVEDGGIIRIEESKDDSGEPIYKKITVCLNPFVLCGKSTPIEDEGVLYKIRYADQEGEIKEFWANMTTLLVKKDLKELFLRKGINCPENNILFECVDYISLSIAYLGIGLKRGYGAIRNGWDDDKTRFVVGDRCVTRDGIDEVLTVAENKNVFENLKKEGSLKEWSRGVNDILSYDIVRFKCYDAMTAPLKALLNIESHVTDHYGNTSAGKTFTSWLALSMIGDAQRLMIGAKSTKKGILVHVRDFSDLPILIDETSDAGDAIGDIVYTLTSNKGRVKSTTSGALDGGEHYRTTAMMTGEKPVRDCLTNSGQMYRVNEIQETLPQLSTGKIKKITDCINQNHGHVIELFIQELFKSEDKLQGIYEKCIEEIPDTTSNIEGRSKLIFACIMTSGIILEKIFKRIGIDAKDPGEVVSNYFKKCILEKPIELEYIRALRVVVDWVGSEYGRFAVVNEFDENDERIKDHSKRYGWVDGQYIDIIGSEFTKKMKDEGFSPTKIKEDWIKEGVTVENDPRRKGTCRFKRGNMTRAGIRIDRQVATILVGDVDEEELRAEKPNPLNRQIVETIKLLSVIHGRADVDMIKEVVGNPNIGGYLDILTKKGIIFKLSETSYKM